MAARRLLAVVLGLMLIALFVQGENRINKRKQYRKPAKPIREGEEDPIYHRVNKWLREAKKDKPKQRTYHRETTGREAWWAKGQLALEQALLRQNLNRNVAKNVIIFIGDGMGITTTSAARIMEGFERDDGVPGEENLLSFEKFPFSGFSKTYNADWQTADSAASGTAILCGIKNRFNTIGMDESVVQLICESATKEAEARSILYWAEDEGKSTGVVTNTAITHATPAAAYANSVSRLFETDADILPGQNCTDIAAQLIEKGHDIEVILGGGRSRFFTESMEDPEEPGRVGDRQDGRNLLKEWEDDKIAKGAVHNLVHNAYDLDDVDTENTDYLLGLFARGHMSYERERPERQPSLSTMTRKAVEVLQKNDKGFFLMVEGGRIDFGHHGSRPRRALTDTIELSNAVQTAVDMTSEDDTLIIVTADHSHVFTFGGYHAKGTDVLDKALLPADDFMPYTKLLYGNGPGYNHTASENGRENILFVDTTANSYVSQSAVPMGSETHGGEDVGIYARGPMAHLIQGVQEQHYIAHAAAYAACIGANKGHCSGPEFVSTIDEGASDSASGLVPAPVAAFILSAVAFVMTR